MPAASLCRLLCCWLPLLLCLAMGPLLRLPVAAALACAAVVPPVVVLHAPPWWLSRLLLLSSPAPACRAAFPSSCVAGLSLLLCFARLLFLLLFAAPRRPSALDLLPRCSASGPAACPFFCLLPLSPWYRPCLLCCRPSFRVALLQQDKDDPSESLGDVHQLDRSGGPALRCPEAGQAASERKVDSETQGSQKAKLGS